MKGDFLKIAVVVIAAGALITAILWPNDSLGAAPRRLSSRA